MTANERLVLETRLVKSIQYSPTRPGEWAIMAKRMLDRIAETGEMTRSEFCEKIGMPEEQLLLALNKTPLEEYDRFDEGINKAIERNAKHFTRNEVLCILRVDLEREVVGDLVLYCALSARAHCECGRLETRVLSDDESYRTSLATKGLSYYTSHN